MKKETSRTTEEQKYENELKDFLFGIADRIESAEPAKQRDVIRKIREEYNCLCEKLRLLISQNDGERYSELIRRHAPVLYRCIVILQFYEKGYDNWNREKRQAGNHAVLKR